MLTTAGSGFSRCGNRSVTRWREDAVCDDWGSYFYLRDVRSGAVWSGGFQPALRESQNYEAIFTDSKADFKRRDAGILTHTEIIVSNEDDAELRRLTVVNESTRTREIEIASYSEIVLTEQAADNAHTAFSNMFVETEFVSDSQSWTWYTGSAAWLYRAALENILGFQKSGEFLTFAPCIPRDWKEFEITYRYKSAAYHITFENPHNVCGGRAIIGADGKTLSSNRINLADDGQTHRVRIVLEDSLVNVAAN